jgi:uncharacterized protein YecT (DUF1311 family)
MKAIFSVYKVKGNDVNLKKFVVIALALSCFSQVVLTEDDGLTKQFGTCMDKSGGVTSEMLDCIGKETKLQDARLNKNVTPFS